MKSFKLKYNLIGLTLAFLLGVALIIGCNKETDNPPVEDPKGNLDIALTLSNAGVPVGLNEEVTLASGYKVNLSNMRIYISSIKGIKANGDEVDFKDVALLDLKELRGTSMQVKAQQYTGLKIGLGLNPALNSSEPSTFVDENPLSSFQGMYWSMLKYRFAVIEGRVNSVSNPLATDELFTYHTGTDAAYRETSINYSFDVSEDQLSTTVLTLTVELDELFNGNGGDLEPTTNNSTHSQPSEMGLTNKIMDNLKGSLFIEGVVIVE